MLKISIPRLGFDGATHADNPFGCDLLSRSETTTEHRHDSPETCELRCNACGYSKLVTFDSFLGCLADDPFDHLCHHEGHLVQRARYRGKELVTYI